MAGQKQLQHGGQFKKGVSGNPSGRPKADTANLRPLLAKHGAEVLSIVIEQAVAGDLAACKLVLDRVYPAIKPQSSFVQVPSKETMVDQGDAIISAVLKGDVPSDTGSSLMTMLAAQGKLIELNDLIARIEVLEAGQ